MIFHYIRNLENKITGNLYISNINEFESLESQNVGLKNCPIYIYVLILWRNPTTFTKLTLRIIVLALVLILPLPNIATL